MKIQILGAVLLFAGSAQAQDLVVKMLACEGSQSKAVVEVSQDSEGSLGAVRWQVQNKTTGETTRGSGYLYAQDNLNSFSSMDVFDGIEVRNQVLTLIDSSGEQIETLSCH